MTITAKIIADSISEQNIRITSIQCRYPKFIHGEFLTHRQFSRNSSSSRAIPVERLIKDVEDDPVIPSFWGKNQKGMQANEECDELINQGIPREDAWIAARDHAIKFARMFNNAGYHKQIVNRLLEPFCHINTIVTATEWSNFFALRLHKDAQPEMRMLAEAIFNAMQFNKPTLLRPGEWHLPYCPDVHGKPSGMSTNDDAIKVSVARGARCSYLTQEGKTPTIEEDLQLYDRLISSVPLHASPAEHQAMPDKFEKTWAELFGDEWARPELHGNFKGWIQYRKLLEGECQ